ncbi:MAG TPA: class I SAM-dependent methyltransferase [Caldilineaceae bacterium]|nr:class I SAM-dependent methyltransferase [Caldilineaceae bacterium]
MTEPILQSTHVDVFNHDPWAENYDVDVRNETDPIRAGYSAVLDWVVAEARIDANTTVVDLGMGTGNTAQRVRQAQELIGVDISTKMMVQAAPKLSHLPNVRYVTADLLSFFHEPRHFDALISTYAIHHLTESEKEQLFAAIHRSLPPGRRAVFGDLMFADRNAEATLRAEYQALGNSEMVETFDEEFFWYVDHATRALQAVGFKLIATKQFSQLSWGIAVEK